MRVVFKKLGDRYGTRAQTAIRFALANPDLSCVIVGFAEIGHIEEALAGAEMGPLPEEALAALREVYASQQRLDLRPPLNARNEATLRIESVETILASLPLPGAAWGDSIHHVTHIEIVVDRRADRYRPGRHRLQLHLGRRRHDHQSTPGQGPGALHRRRGGLAARPLAQVLASRPRHGRRRRLDDRARGDRHRPLGPGREGGGKAAGRRPGAVSRARARLCQRHQSEQAARCARRSGEGLAGGRLQGLQDQGRQAGHRGGRRAADQGPRDHRRAAR